MPFKSLLSVTAVTAVTLTFTYVITNKPACSTHAADGNQQHNYYDHPNKPCFHFQSFTLQIVVIEVETEFARAFSD